MGRLAVPDEGSHFYRAWLVSDGRCLALPAVGTSLDYRLIDRDLPWQQLPPSTDGRAILTHVDPAHGHPIGVVALFYAVDLYSCLPYLPAGAAIRVGRFFSDSPLTLMYLGRFANLFLYLALTLAALRLLPGFQLPLAALALMPMSLHQAASLSADSFTLGFSFFLTAWILHLAITPSPFTRRDYLLLAVAALFAGLCKSSAGLLFLLLLIPTARFRRASTRWLAVAALILLGFATAAAWQAINYRNVEIHATLKHAMDVYPDANARTILQHPVAFLTAVLRTSTHWAFEYLEEFVGKLAWLVIRLPLWIPWLYLALLLAAAALSHPVPALLPGQRLILAGVFLLNLALIIAVVWTTEITRDAMTHDFLSGRGFIPGLQGRYLIPFAAAPLLALSGLALRLRAGRWLEASVFAAILIVNAVALHSVWNFFESHSSTLPNRLRMALHSELAATPENAAQRYDGRVISARSAAGDGSIFMVSSGVRHPVPHLLSITYPGYRVPDDILLVPDADLAAIPEGDPLPLPRSKYEGQLVRRPGDSPEDGKIFIVRELQKHWIIDGRWITANGFKWPDDVKIIPSADLEAIPEGSPIQ